MFFKSMNLGSWSRLVLLALVELDVTPGTDSPASELQGSTPKKSKETKIQLQTSTIQVPTNHQQWCPLFISFLTHQSANFSW
jgi:hypothetical protein